MALVIIEQCQDGVQVENREIFRMSIETGLYIP